MVKRPVKKPKRKPANELRVLDLTPHDGHKVFSPSGAAGWANCHGKLWLLQRWRELGYPIPESSDAAIEGTHLHDVGEKMLEGDLLAREVDPELTAEQVDVVTGYYNYVTQLGGEQYYEVFCEAADFIPDGGGTADAVCVHDDSIDVVDLKCGKGIFVKVLNNLQLIIYAIGALRVMSEKYPDRWFRSVTIHIYQPRLNNIESVVYQRGRLMEFREWLHDQSQLVINNPDAARTPGDKQCAFCYAEAICDERKQQITDLIMVDFEDLTIPDQLPKPEDMKPEQIAAAMNAAALASGWFKAVESHAYWLAMKGTKIPDWKVVEGRSNRKFADEEDAAFELDMVLGDEAYTKTLLSPAKLEKMLGAKGYKKIEHLIVKPTGSPTLVKFDDPRPSLDDVVDMFDDHTEDEW